MLIRAAREDEIEAIADLHVAAYAEYAPSPRDGQQRQRAWAGYQDEIRDVKSRWSVAEHLVVEEDGRLIASATFFPNASVPELVEDAWPDGYASFRLLSVHPDARGRGLGRMLTDECVARARKNGSRWIGLHTTKLMTQARQMYERLGFTRFPQQDIPITDDFVVVAYRLALSPGIAIRDARPDELERIADLMVESYDQYETRVPEDLWSEYKAEIHDVWSRLPYSQLIVAERESDGELLGAVTFYADATTSQHDVWTEGFAEMRLLAVPPAARGLGLGHVLAQECIARARRNGNPVIGLHTSYLMNVAEGMYQRMGFARAEEFDFKPEGDTDIVAVAYRMDL